MPWLSLKVEVDAAQADALSDALLESGARSVAIDRVGGELVHVEALLALDADPASVLAQAACLARLAAIPGFSASRVEDEDWVRKTQAQFAPIPIDERLWIVPSWHEIPPGAAGAAIVRLDPGLAFGTGTHPSTRLVLQFLARVVHGGERVLDYGCGSGILAIAACKLGAGQVDAVDLDPDAVRATVENATLNAVDLRAALPDALAPAVYDLVVSNILAQPLMLLAPLLAARTTGGGRIALSGILHTQADEVAHAYAPYFDARPTLIQDGWALVEGVRR
jgi:ribosomal protein L11 methyltransferase